MNKAILCQEYFDHKMGGVVSMFVSGRDRRFVVFRKKCLLKTPCIQWWVIFRIEDYRWKESDAIPHRPRGNERSSCSLILYEQLWYISKAFM